MRRRTMPNWCANRVTVSGDSEYVQAFKKAVHGIGDRQDSTFSFNSIIPFPKELRGIGSPVKIVETEEEIEQYKEKHSDSKWLSQMLPITQKKSDELIKKYGSDNWYDWCTENWTTKWDACDITLLDEEDYLQYTFDTAWGPPESIYFALIEEHPQVNISWFYDEPGMEISGYLKVMDTANSYY